MDMIKTEQLQYNYRAESLHPALNGISISIRKGEFVAVLGHNGSGKSTFAKHLNAILLPSGGAVYVQGMDTRDEKLLYDIRQRVGMVFQNPDNQIVASLVEEDVAFAPENLGVPPAEIQKRVDAALEAVGMLKYKDRATYQLSGGQKQRVAIAGIIAMQPECVVLDEPTAMLDPHGRRSVMRAIHAMNHDLGITVVLITHHMNEAVGADRVLVMSEGQVALDGTPEQVFTQVERLRGLSLDVPATTEVLWQLKQAGLSLPLDALEVETCAQAIAGILK